MVGKLPSPKVVWVMVPAGEITRQTIATLGELLGEGDVVVDGGNSRYTDDRSTPRRSPSTASATSTPVSPAVCGGWTTATP